MGFFDLFQQADIDQGVKEYLATPGAVLLDVRTSEEYRDGHIPGSKNVPLQALDKVASVAENKNMALYVYCHSGARSRQAAGLLRQAEPQPRQGSADWTSRLRSWCSSVQALFPTLTAVCLTTSEM